ncbi:relaxase [Pseudomonas sp. ATCC PTA-122608]|uniref:MobH family relaxase n=1 Tax=Pseudomonas sp. ATCC PTA-122608 TaxID=1771311 RepID=UPI00096BBE2D|nr:MobH family relaxase [Pseudomonas sp. ATCC PTA-122608]OLY75751.1 relaxase [Pseudomonas sp. ATCC PTA-122608]
MFWQSKLKKATQTESQTITAGPHEYLAPKTASELLSTPRRSKLLEHIWQRTSLSRSQFDDLYLEPVRRYAELVQELPASENHHHAYPGGMLDHGLEIVAFALKIRQSHLLPIGATPEAQAAQTEIWTAALAYAALLHDIGKIAVDVEVHLADGTRWHPWHGPVSREYRFKYLKGRQYKLHGAAAGLLYTQILTKSILDWLSAYADPWSALIYVLAGQYEHAGTLGELVIQADQASVAQELGGNPSRALAAPKHSAQRQLVEGLRYLVAEQLKLNQPRASDGWLTDDALWLVSKTVADKLRAHLLSQGAESIPSSNSTLFNVLQDNAIIQVNAEGKAIWTATVQSGKWQKTLTFLNVAPALIWEKGERPPSFAGLITVGPVAEPSGEEAHVELEPFPQRPLDIPKETSPVLTEKPTETSYKLAPLEYMEATQYPDDLWEGHRTCMTEENESVPSHQSSPTDAVSTEAFDDTSQPRSLPGAVPITVDGVSGKELGEAFVRWLRRGVLTHKVIINDAKAKVHSVAGTAFLVTPGIFQRYAQEHPELARVAKEQGTTDWRWVQRCFEKLSIHMKCASGLNIWACEVRGPRKTRDIRGYLLNDPLQIFTEKPYDNPYLALKGSPTFKDEAPCM